MGAHHVIVERVCLCKAISHINVKIGPKILPFPYKLEDTERDMMDGPF